MFNLFEKIDDVVHNADVITRRRYGVITIVEGQLESIAFRPWPKLISGTEISWLGNKTHGKSTGDRCVLYYNQPVSHSSFLALKYIVSNLGTSYRSLRESLSVLDQIAEIKRSDALLCEVFNQRISDRFLARMGWERHNQSSRKRHFIKRFYGVYPSSSNAVVADTVVIAHESAKDMAAEELATPPKNPTPALFQDANISSPDSPHV